MRYTQGGSSKFGLGAPSGGMEDEPRLCLYGVSERLGVGKGGEHFANRTLRAGTLPHAGLGGMNPSLFGCFRLAGVRMLVAVSITGMAAPRFMCNVRRMIPMVYKGMHRQ